MPKAYWIGRVDVSNPEAYKAYMVANAIPFKKYGARFLVRGGQFETPEGSSRSRNVVRVQGYATALACYNSPEYQHAITLRTPHSVGDIAIISYDGVQPGVRRGFILRSWFRWIAILALVGLSDSAGVIGVGLRFPRPCKSPWAPPVTNAENRVSSASGATIRGWFTKPPGHGAVVLVRRARNRLSMVRRARLLAQGFAVLLFAFRRTAKAPRITFGHLEGRDAAAAVAFMRQRAPSERIGVIGATLGGAAALLAPDGLHVDAMVLESVYPDIGSATANRISAALGAPLGPLLSRPVALLFELLMAPILGATSFDLRPIDRMVDIKAPVLVIGGTSDTSTTPDETTAMFERAQPPKYSWLIQGAGHVDAEQYGLEAYHARVFGFLSERLRRQ